MQEYKRGSHTVWDCKYHLVWTTKYRYLATLGEGDYFGEMSLLTGEPRSASVVAEGPCETYVLARADLAPILESDPAVAETLSRVLAERTAATVARFEDRRSRGVEAAGVEREQESLLGRIRQLFKL